MDVLLNEEEKMLQDTARAFLEEECPVRVVRQMEHDEKGYPPELWKQIADLGWLGLALPEKYDGQELPLTYLGIILEAVGRALAPLPLHSTMVAALTLAQHGPEALCQAVLPSVVKGEAILTWAFTEQDPRFLPETVETQAVADGNDFVINGTKLFVDNVVSAEKCLVVCRTDAASTGKAGLSLFLVDTNSAGLSQTPLVTMARDKQSEVVFQDVRVSKDNLVGDLNQGWPIVERMLEQATVLLCSQMLGAARKDAEMAIDYAKNRTAFGRPIGAFQSVAHLCADMIIWIDGGHLLTYEALWKMDQGLPAGVEVSQAKAFCNEKCEAAVRLSQTIHGGIGFMEEFDLQLWFRRVSSWTMRLGTSFEHRAKVIQALLDYPGRVELGRPMVAVG